MKPWICEDSELGGRELGGNTVDTIMGQLKHYEVEQATVKSKKT